SLAAVGTRPIGLRPDQTNPRAVGVIVNFPRGGKEHLNIGESEKIGRTVRAIENPDLPLVAVKRNHFRRRLTGEMRRVALGKPENIPYTQRSPCMSAKSAQDKGTAAVKILRNIDAACHRQV